ncbi:hypothetical protein ACH5RR_007896 [Cinchona calisaya]|uniref:Exocyst subunit Exo70 family protein n=1 Tax=Cinchona calisaya TaxID=153742 RepID=A0ABD3ABK3_9GENT
MGIVGSSQSLQSAIEVVSNWDSQPKERLIFDFGREEVKKYLQAVVKILQQSSSADQNTNNNEHKNIISMSITRLKNEFRAVLTRQTESVMASNSATGTELSSSITDSTSYQFRYEDFVAYELPNAEVIRYLRSIAETMHSSGHLDDCIEVYKSVRRPFVDAIFKRFRLDELKVGDIKKFLWEELKMKIERWIQAARACTKYLFKREKQFAAQVFSQLGGSSVDEECFLYVAKNAAVSLFSFAESLSLSHQSSERLEKILILYEEMLSLKQDVNALFQSESAKDIRNGIAATLSRLEDEVRRMLTDFENAVLNEISTIRDDGGRVHPLTKHVMGYANLIVKYRRILERLIVSRPSMILGDRNVIESELQDLRSQLSTLGLHLVLIIAVLQLNLENKSNYFKDPALGYLFMMNNVNYIVQKIAGSRELQEMIGADYLKKLNGNVEGAMTKYQDGTCSRLLTCLRDEGLYVSRCFASRVSVSALRNRMETFNTVFEEIRLLQSKWEVQSSSLQEELRTSMLKKLMPAYERFLRKFSSHIESGKQRKISIQLKIHVKYSVKDLEALIMTNLFVRHQQTPSSEVPVENFHLGA